MKAGGNHELSAAVHRMPALIQGDHRAGPHQHVWTLRSYGPDGVEGGGGAEGNLHNSDTAGKERFCGGNGVLGSVQDHHGHNAAAAQSVQCVLFHVLAPLTRYQAVPMPC